MSDDLGIILSLKNKKILFVGVGNLLRQDDGVGPYITSRIISTEKVSSLTVEASIENYIGKINSLKPDILVIIDCMDIRSRPGTYKLISLNQIRDHTFNTHNISLRHLSEFFEMPVFILGIQPEKIAFGENISYLVKNEADKIINQINSGR